PSAVGRPLRGGQRALEREGARAKRRKYARAGGVQRQGGARSARRQGAAHDSRRHDADGEAMRQGLALLLLAAGCAAATRPAVTASQSGKLDFIEDDYPRALAQARERKRPIFVDVWAPWCHTCRFMRANVLSDGALAREAPRFVWLAINRENPRNGEFF